MDTVNAPVQKKPFPVAAITFSVSVFTLFIWFLQPVTSQDFEIRPAQIILCFLTAVPLICLVVGLFLRKTNLLVTIPMCVLAAAYAGITVLAIIDWVRVLPYLAPHYEANISAFLTQMWSHANEVCQNGLVCLGFFLLAVITFAARKNSAMINKLWILPIIPFGLATFLSLLSMSESLYSFLFTLTSGVPFTSITASVLWYYVRSDATIEVTFLLFTLSALFYGLALKKSAKI